MRWKATTLLIALTLCLSSCARFSPVSSDLDLPARPPMLPVVWIHENGLHSLDDANARNLLINMERKDTHIEILEGFFQVITGR